MAGIAGKPHLCIKGETKALKKTYNDDFRTYRKNSLHSKDVIPASEARRESF